MRARAPGPCPAFWLLIAGTPGTRELPLDVLDASCLLMSRRVAVELIDHPEIAVGRFAAAP